MKEFHQAKNSGIYEHLFHLQVNNGYLAWWYEKSGLPHNI